MAGANSIKEYLKRYESGAEDLKKKKKKRKKENPRSESMSGVLVVDEDPVWQKPVQIEEPVEELSEDEKPQVDEDIEVKRMKRLEAIRSRKPYHSIAEDGSGWVSVSESSKAGGSDLSLLQQSCARFDTPSPHEHQKGDEDLSPPRRGKHSPPEVEEPRLSTISDLSPPRRRKGLQENDFSPPRRNTRKESLVSDLSPLRRSHGSPMRDLSPPRRSSKRLPEELSPPSRRQQESPHNDLSPPRRSRKGLDGDHTPHGQLRSMEVKESRDTSMNNLSPPRRKRKGSPEDLSPPRQSLVQETTASDLSPERRRLKVPEGELSQLCRGRHHSPEANGSRKSPAADLPLPRRRKEASSNKETQRTGLLTLEEIKKENDKKRKEELSRYASMNPSLMGKAAEPVFRDREGRRISKELMMKSNEVEKPKEEKKLEWGKGLAQKREAEARATELEIEKDKPFARTRDDPELDTMLKEKIRWGDPMAHLVKRKQSDLALEDFGENEKMKESGFIIPQTVPNHSWIKRGIDFPPNRYGIRPGRHWDGVDRSSGYEKEMFNRQNQKRATEAEAYLWSVADM